MTERRGLLWPLVLIAVGALVLAANLGYLPWSSATALVRLWPLLLVLAGIDVALARRAPVVALALEVLVIGAGIALAVAQPALPYAGAGQDELTVAREPQDESLTLHVNGGGGAYTITGGGSALVGATAAQPDLRSRTTRGGTNVDVRLDQGDAGPALGFGASPMEVTVHVASDIPTSLDVNGGAGSFQIDLSRIRVTDARINTGAAQLRLVLPRPRGDVPITVNAGASSIVVEIPDGVEAKVSLKGALTSLDAQNPRFSGDATSGYGSAMDRVTVSIVGGAASVTIR